MQIPDDEVYDIIAGRPLIDNKNIVHHILVMGCEGELSDEEVGK